MEHLVAVGGVLAIATFVTGLVLPLTTRRTRGVDAGAVTDHEQVLAAELAAGR
jgi:hypothetical protein